MLPSASGRRRLSLCQWWARPDVTAPQAPSSDAASRGTAFHEAVERGDFTHADPQVAELLVAWNASDWSRIKWFHEVAFGFDERGPRQLHRGGHRDYPADVTFAGTADLAANASGRAIVADLKTSHETPGDDAIAQVAILGALCASAWGIPRAECYVLHVTPDGVSAQRLDLDRDAIRAELERLRMDLDAAKDAQPKPGTHCGYCPARTVCPAIVRPELVAVESPAPVAFTVTPENAGLVVLGIAAMRERLDAMERACRAIATERGSIALPDGQRWGPTPREVERVALTTDAAAWLLSELPAAVETKHATSKAAIEREAKKAGKSAREILDGLRSRGAIRVHREDRYGVIGGRDE